MQFHPDRNPGDKTAEHKFKEINEAYDVLKDDQKRAAYDRFGHRRLRERPWARGGAGGFDFAAGGGGFADIFEEMFGEFMGGRRGQQARQRGGDLRYNMEITLRRPSPASRRRSAWRARPPARPAHGSGGGEGLQAHHLPDLPRQRQGPRSPRASSPSRRPAPAARAAARSSTSPAAPAAARAAAARTRPSTSPSRRGSRTAPASAWPAKARRACAARPAAISTSSSPWRPTSCSSARAPISIAASRSP